MTIEELAKQFEDYKKVSAEKEEKMKKDYEKHLEELQASHEKEIEETRKKVLEFQLGVGKEPDKKEVDEEDKIVTFEELSKDIGKEEK